MTRISPGLRPTVGYVDARSATLDQLVDLILQKLQRPLDQAASVAAPIRVPRTAEQQRQLVAQRPPNWEYLLFAGVLVQGKDALEPKWRDHQLRYVRRTRPALSDADVAAFIEGAFRELAGITSNIERILDAEAKERAFGPPGIPGDPVHIEHLGQRLLELYEGLLDWSANIRGAPVSDQFRRAFELLASYPDYSIRDLRAFIDQYADKIGPLSKPKTDPNEEPIVITMYIHSTSISRYPPNSILR
jgi:hypothetical protein